MFNLNPAQSTVTNGVSYITNRLSQTSDAAVIQPFVQALQGALGVEQAKLGVEVAKEEVGWKIYSEANNQFGKLVAKG